METVAIKDLLESIQIESLRTFRVEGMTYSSVVTQMPIHSSHTLVIGPDGFPEKWEEGSEQFIETTTIVITLEQWKRNQLFFGQSKLSLVVVEHPLALRVVYEVAQRLLLQVKSESLQQQKLMNDSLLDVVINRKNPEIILQQLSKTYRVSIITFDYSFFPDLERYYHRKDQDELRDALSKIIQGLKLKLSELTSESEWIGESIRFQTKENKYYQIKLTPLKNDYDYYGLLCVISDENSQLSTDELLESGGRLLLLDVIRRRAMSKYMENKELKKLQEVLATFDLPKIETEHLSNYLQSPNYLYVFRVHRQQLQRAYNIISQTLNQLGIGCFLWIHKDHLICIHNERLPDDIMSCLINERVEIYCGISPLLPIRNMHDIRKKYQMAFDASEVAIKKKQKIVHWKELSVSQLVVRLKDQPMIVDAMREKLLPLIEADEKYGMDLLQTLHVYYLNNKNQTKTAEQLFVHPNTVKHRLQRIEKLVIEPSIYSYEGYLYYALALEVIVG